MGNSVGREHQPDGDEPIDEERGAAGQEAHDDPYAALPHGEPHSPARSSAPAGGEASSVIAREAHPDAGVARPPPSRAAGRRAYAASQFPHIPPNVTWASLMAEGLRPDLAFVPFQMQRTEPTGADEDDDDGEEAARRLDEEKEESEAKRPIVRCRNPFHLVKATLQMRPVGGEEATAAAATPFASYGPTIAAMPTAAGAPSSYSPRNSTSSSASAASSSSRTGPPLPPKPIASSSSLYATSSSSGSSNGAAGAASAYTVHFTFESLLPVRVSVHWLCTEVRDDETPEDDQHQHQQEKETAGGGGGGGRVKYLSTTGTDGAPQIFPKGQHTFSLPLGEALQVGQGLTEAQMTESHSLFYYPLVIVMEEAAVEPKLGMSAPSSARRGSPAPSSSSSSSSPCITHLTTYCSLQRSSSASSLVTPKVVRTAARVAPSGDTFEIQEIFGLRGESRPEGDEAEEEEKAAAGAPSLQAVDQSPLAATPTATPLDCLVCMGSDRDTAMLPCRHFCVCRECARTLQRQTPPRCPVCRSRIESTVRITMPPPLYARG